MVDDDLEGFEAFILKSKDELVVMQEGRGEYQSPSALVERLHATKANENTYMEIRFYVFENMKRNDGKLELALEAENLFKNKTVLSLSKNTAITLYFLKTCKKAIAVELASVMNILLRSGIRFAGLRIFYEGSFSFSKDIFDTLTESVFDIAGLQENLPPLGLRHIETGEESKALKNLSNFLRVGWPIEEFYFARNSFKGLENECQEVKNLIEDSRQQFKLKLENTGQEEECPTELFEAFSSIVTEVIAFEGFSIELVAKFFEPSLQRWENETEEIRSLVISISDDFKDIVCRGSACGCYVSKGDDQLLYKLINMFRKRQLLLVEQFELEVEEHNSHLLYKLYESVLNNRSLFSFSVNLVVGDDKTKIEIPEVLMNQIKSNIARKEDEDNLPKHIEGWISTGGRIKYGRMKLMLIGQGRAGKTSTLRSMLGKTFDPDIQSTLLADVDKDVSMTMMNVSFCEWKQINFDSHWLSDEMGEKLHRVKNGVEKVSNPSEIQEKSKPRLKLESLEESEIQQTTDSSKVKQKKRESNELSVIIPKNRETEFDTSMFSTGDLSSNILNLLQNNKNVKETYAKDNARLTIWDFGGQQVFYSLHHLYITRGGVFVLVFNLKNMKDSPEAELDVLEFWMESVALHAESAGVILVGTRSDEVSKGDCKFIDLALSQASRKVAVNIISADDAEFCFFPLDNSNAKTIESNTRVLKDQILKCFEGKHQVLNNVWTKHIPLAWMYFMNSLSHQFKTIVSINQVMELASRLKLDKNRDVIPMIKFYETAGAILPFLRSEKEETTLSGCIVMHPSWLLKALANFIYDPSLHLKKRKIAKTIENNRMLAEYEESAVLSQEFLIHILQNNTLSEAEVHFILDLCKDLLLISHFDFKPQWSSKDDQFFIVPAMVSKVVGNRRKKKAAVTLCHNILISFKRYIPIGLYERVFCLMLSANEAFDGSTLKPSVFKDFSLFHFRNYPVYLVNEKKLRRFRVALPKNQFGDDANPSFNVIKVVEQILSDLKKDALGKKFNPELVLERKIHDEGEEVLLQCFWNDLKESVGKDNSEVRCIGPDGVEEFEEVNLFSPFQDVAVLALGRSLEEEAVVLEWEHDCFLAHTWGPRNETHEQVIGIGKELEAIGLRIWIDDANLKDFVSVDIVRGLVRSASVVVFVTKLYLEKLNNPDTNAAREFRQAVQKGIYTLIPVILEEELLDPFKWLGTSGGYQLQDRVFFDFSSEEAKQKNFPGLVEKIKELGERERPFNEFDV